MKSNFPIRRLLDSIRTVGATISPYGTISHPSTPNLVIHRLNVKEFVPYLREMVRHQLVTKLATRSAKVSRGRPCRSDFSTLAPLVDWPATLSGLLPRKDEIVEINEEDAPDQGRPFEIRSKALTVILSGAQRTMERLHRHKEPIHPGLPPPSSPICPWCDAGVEETHHHLFWECEAFSDLRTPHVLKIRSIQAPFQDLPIMRWEVACKCNGICPEDMAIIEWQKSLLPEDYDPLPPFLPDPSLLFFSEDGLALVGTDGGTDLPRDRRLRHSGIGIFGGGSSTWNYHSPLLGPIQMNDKAELVAATLAVEGAVDQPLSFALGIEIIIDNKGVCDTCCSIAKGQSPRPTLAHIVWYRRMEKAIKLLLASNRVVRFTWVPSHTTAEDVSEARYPTCNDC